MSALPSQLDLFASPQLYDRYSLIVPRASATTPLSEATGVATDQLSGCLRANGPQCTLFATGADDATCDTPSVLPPALQPKLRAPRGNTLIVTPQGQPVSVSQSGKADEMAPADRLEAFRYLVERAVGGPVRWSRLATPRTEGLDPQRTGGLYVVGEPTRDVVVRLNGGKRAVQGRQEISLHIGPKLHEEMGRHTTALQGIVARVRQAGHVDLLVVAAIPYAVLAPTVAALLAASGGVRASLKCEITCNGRGVTLRIPSPAGDVDVSHYAGVETLAAALRGHPREPWRSWTHADWMAVVASVLTLRSGRHCSVAPLDSRKLVNRAVLEELGIRAHGHRLDLPAACREALVYTDVLAAPVSPALRWHPRQPLTAVEIDAESDMTAPAELARRMRSAARLGLKVTEAVVVADEAKRDKFNEWRELLSSTYRGRLRLWPMHEVFEEYGVLRTARLRDLARATAPVQPEAARWAA